VRSHRPTRIEHPPFEVQVALKRAAPGLRWISLGALAVGTMLVGAVAIGALAIRALAMKRGEIEVRRLHVRELMVEREQNREV